MQPTTARERSTGYCCNASMTHVDAVPCSLGTQSHKKQAVNPMHMPNAIARNSSSRRRSSSSRQQQHQQQQEEEQQQQVAAAAAAAAAAAGGSSSR